MGPQNTSFNHANNIQHEFSNSSTSAVFMAPMSPQPQMPLYNHDDQYNNAYSANCFVPNTNSSIVLTSVSQNLGIYNRSVGFRSNMQQPFYQKVACSTPPSPPIGIGFRVNQFQMCILMYLRSRHCMLNPLCRSYNHIPMLHLCHNLIL